MNKQTLLITLSILITPLLHTTKSSRRQSSLPPQERSASAPLDNKDHPDKYDPLLDKKINALVASFFERENQPPKHRSSASEASIDTTSPSRAPQARTLEYSNKTTLAPRQKDSRPKAQKKQSRKKNGFYCDDTKCSKKNYNWKSPFKLKRHAFIHSGEKPFKCTICSECFNQKSITITHMRAKGHIQFTKEALRIKHHHADDADVSQYLLSNKWLNEFVQEAKE